MPKRSRVDSCLRALCVVIASAALTAACGDSGSGGSASSEDPGPSEPTDPGPSDPGPSDPGPSDPGPGEPTDPGEPACDETFDSTYDAIQAIVFERRGCTAEACHGSAASGDLDLRAGASYDSLFEAPSVASPLVRVLPGTRERSFLWLKLLAATDPSVEVAGSPMPLAAEPLSADELELVRLWIVNGAPREGTVLDTEALTGGCLPDPEPIIIKPLEPPPAGEGVQLVMPPRPLEAASESEVCFATIFDVSDQVPPEFQSEDGKFFYFNAIEIRQDPSSHHLLIQAPQATLLGEEVDIDLVSGWACLHGARDGEACDPRDPDACGEGGWCTSPIESSTACIGYSAAPEIQVQTFTGTQQAQFAREDYPGVFNQAPIRGLVFWNSHAFNLTTSATDLNARINFRFASDRRFPSRGAGAFDNLFGIPQLLAEGPAPYTKGVLCGETILPEGARLTSLNSHTHQRGEHFWFELPSGEHIYDSFVYNDPVQKFFDPPLDFFSADEAERTLTWCALFNNGVDEDGNPDPEAVTRSSRIPYGVRGFGSDGLIGLCEPTRCVNPGMFDVNCDDRERNQRGDDAACDSSPGAGDGLCDACRITGGVTTENEMFSPLIGYFVEE